MKEAAPGTGGKTVARKKINDLNWMVGGEAGSGIQSAGHLMALLCSRAGLSVFGNAEYPSLIRGGHNSNVIRVADFEVSIHKDKVDLLLALNAETLDLHLREIAQGGAVIYDGAETPDYKFPGGWKKGIGTAGNGRLIFDVPLSRLAEKAGLSTARNVVGLGAVLALLGLPVQLLLKVLKENFARKGTETVEKNLAAARAGYNYVVENFDVTTFGFGLRPVNGQPRRLLLTGNDAVCLGAIRAGVKLVAEYPMTPASSVLHFMAKAARDYNIIVKQPEDELAAINMAIGAGWAGARSMAATSGGGFSLMSEALGFAGMTETPVVIYEAQRGGPSTGLPTRTEQSDLQFVIHASQGEFPRLVVAPGDFDELFYKTFEAFNLAEKYQMPAIILGDKHLSESIKNIRPFVTKELKIDRGKLIRDPARVAALKKLGHQSPDGGFLRYKFTDDEVSPRLLPGTKGGRYRSSSDEHDESGDLTETEENRIAMHAKRLKKLESCLKDLPAPKLIGPARDGSFTAGPAYPAEKADVTFVTWGSPKDALLEVLQMLKKDGVKANLLPITYFVPFHGREVKKILSRCKWKIGVEMNQQAQMCEYITAKTGIFMDAKILKWSGRQLTAEEIYSKYMAVI